jgi:hypothetical protein
MAYTRQYKTFLKPEKRIPRSQIRPRNIYRITTYSGGDPVTQSGDKARYVFVIGKVDNKYIHCIKLNDIRPNDFINFINKLRDKRIPIGSDQSLELLLKKFSIDGKSLFESYVKNNSKIYSSSLGNYRSYLLEKIQNVYEIRFEEGFLKELFKEGSTQSTRREVLRDELTEDITPADRNSFPTRPDDVES